jgi:predicted nucleotidyltransferase
MVNGETILDLLTQHNQQLRERFTVKRLGLFGSYARGEAGPGSDIDLLVELEQPTYDHYMDLKFYLEDLFQTPVDLVMADTVKPRLAPYISREVVYA